MESDGSSSVERIALVIDPEPIERHVVGQFLKGFGFDVSLEETGQNGLETFKTIDPELVIMDYHLRGMTAQQVIDQIKEHSAQTSILLFVNEAPEEALINLFRYDRFGTIRKPLLRNRLKTALDHVLQPTGGYGGPENRKFRRIPTSLEAELGTYGTYPVSNISVDGMYIESDDSLLLGEALQIVIPSLSNLVLEGKIVRRGTHPPGYGIHFIGMEFEQTKEIGLYIYRSLKSVRG